MSAVDTIRDALFGNPPVAGFKPSREGVLAAFTEIVTQVNAATAGMTVYATKALMLAAPAVAAGSQARVYNDATTANNGVYVNKTGAVGAWVIDTNFYNYLASVVQPQVDICNAAVTTCTSAVTTVTTLIGALGDTIVRTNATTSALVEANVRQHRLTHTAPNNDLYAELKVSTTNAFPIGAPNHYMHISWLNTQKGFAQTGKLLTVLIKTKGAVTATGNKLQIWVVRPTATPSSTDGASITFNKVAFVGEINMLDNQSNYPYDEGFPDLNIDVQAGDMIAYRPIGWGGLYGANSGGTHEYDAVASCTFQIADQTSAAFDTSQTTTLSTNGSGRLFFQIETFMQGSGVTGNSGPNALLRLGQSGEIPVAIGTKSATPLKGVSTIILGSSISTASGGGNATDEGHLSLAMKSLGANPTFAAIGGSYACWAATSTGTATENQTIGATAAELTARFGSTAAQWSFENVVLGKGYKCIILPDWINDSNLGNFTIGSYSTADPATLDPSSLYGMMQRMVARFQAEDANRPIYFQTPFHPWASYTATGVLPTEQANRRLARTAMRDLNDKLSCAGVIDYIEYAGVSAYAVKANDGLQDLIHPTQNRKKGASQNPCFVTLSKGGGFRP